MKTEHLTFLVGVCIALVLLFFGKLFSGENLTPISDIFKNVTIKGSFIFLFGIATGYYTSLLFHESKDGRKYWLSGIFLTLTGFVFLVMLKITLPLINDVLYLPKLDSISVIALLLGFFTALVISLSKHTNKIFLGKAVEKGSSYIFNSVSTLFISMNYIVPEIKLILHLDNSLSWVLVIIITVLGVVSGIFTDYSIEVNSR